MERMNQKEVRYQVVLIGMEDNTEERKEAFCKEISNRYSVSLTLSKGMIDDCPVILKKSLPLNKAEEFVKTLQSFGAVVSVEEMEDLPDIFLEFQDMAPHRVELESSQFRKTQKGTWYVTGRGKNTYDGNLNDTWVLIQIFNDLDELLTFEEAPIPINPIPPGEAFPFKVIFEEGLAIKRASIAFKHASGYPIPAVDRRRNREWMELEIKEEDREDSQCINRIEPVEELLTEEPSEIWREGIQLPEQESPPILPEENREIEREGEAELSREAFLLGFEEVSKEIGSERVKECSDVTLEMTKEHGDQVEEGWDPSMRDGPLQMVTQQLPLPLSEESPQLLEEISIRTIAEREEEPFLWIKDFRNAVETYYQKHRDIFSIWFENYQREGRFENSLHSLLTILVHARFHQVGQPKKALENTQRVIHFIAQSNLRLEEVPPLEGTQFFSGEDWRELFYRAFPKIQQVANNILKRNGWPILDLEQLVQVIPHMSDKNSRLSIGWMHEFMPDVVKIDFSNTPIRIGETLYRVASRLGVVDPHFDYYQGRDSIGDLKIQNFAKTTFPQYPLRIEDPMTWVGRKEEEGGHCLPTQPRCKGCLFEAFCPKLYSHFDPSERGIRKRESLERDNGGIRPF
jgi:hypothetical protein